MKAMLRTLLLLVVTAFAASSSAAEFTLASMFTDGMILQRDAVVPVWGNAKPGVRITVVFDGQEKHAITSKSGRWRIDLDPLAVSNEPRQLDVSDGQETLTISDTLVGDVWLCAGQSNMAMRVDLARDAEAEKAASVHPRLRVFTVDYQPAREPLREVSGSWVSSTPETAGRFSACAFYFGRELHRTLDVPIGLIVSAKSGSDITAWTSREAQSGEPALAPLLSSWAEKDAAYTPAVEADEIDAYEKQLASWKEEIRESADSGEAKRKKPRQPVNPRDHWHHPHVLYNGMVAPLIPYAIRGAIWYQGETNAFTEESSALYEVQLPLLIKDWRGRWNQGDFPFAWVQLPFSSARKVAWARIRESMRRATALPKTGMVVTLDLGEERLLHPKNKQAFAHRLALWARANVYGEKVAWSGPMFTGYRVGEKSVLLRFDHSESLAAQGGPLVGFEQRDVNGGWQPVQPQIRNDRVVVPINAKQSPTAIRYAWANHPAANLVNGSGLPASPFLTEILTGKPSNDSAVVSQRDAPPKKRKPAPADLTNPPLDSADILSFPGSTNQLDVFLLMGQSNMKGRGVMPIEPLRDPRVIMMHRRNDQYYLARHPLHLVGNPIDFSGADNAGVGPGLAFAETLVDVRPNTRVLLIPCAVGGTSIVKWKKGQRLYDETIRRAKLALEQGPKDKTRIAGALWLQGEADSATPERIANYSSRLNELIDNLRADIGDPGLPFIACTIGEMRSDVQARKQINHILLDLPNQRPDTACVDGRSFAKSIGDNVHFDTPTQREHGRRFAKLWLKLDSQD